MISTLSIKIQEKDLLIKQLKKFNSKNMPFNQNTNSSSTNNLDIDFKEYAQLKNDNINLKSEILRVKTEMRQIKKDLNSSDKNNEEIHSLNIMIEELNKENRQLAEKLKKIEKNPKLV